MHPDDPRTYWDAEAADFDDEPDHGLTTPEVRQAWVALLDAYLPASRSPVVDLGCGTGSLSILLAQRGHPVLGVDVSPKMITLARRKARAEGLNIDFVIGDVQTAATPTDALGAVVSRHLLWAVPDPQAVIARWSAGLDGDGTYLAIEGVWDEAGIAPEVVRSALERHFEHVEYTDLTEQAKLWGKDVADHRYAIVGRRRRLD